jgi:predicted amidohydrolase YtcJ
MKLLHNARVHTLDPSRPVASALMIDGECIRAVGGEELVLEFDRAPRQDLDGGVVLPGLTDAHLHLQEYVTSRQMVDCEVDSKTECLRRVSDRARQTPVGEWVRGHGWNQNEWGGDWPSAADLDAVAPDHPVYLTAKSLHAAVANRAAMQRAGLTLSTPEPANGIIQRNEQGHPTGLLFEGATRLVEESIPEPSAEARASSLQRTLPELWRMGLTGVHDFDRWTCFRALQTLHERGELALRVVKSIPFDLLPQAVGLGLRSGTGDETLRLGSLKLFADGALGPHTAAMFDPYVDEEENCGILNLDGEAIFEIGRQAAECGLGLAVHAIGDRANHEVLDGFARLRAYEREHGLPALRHRIEHVQLLHPQYAGRLAELEVIASMQPIHATSDMPVADHCWGGRCRLAYAWRTQLHYGAALAFGSDAPVESPNPFWGLHAAVTRRRADGSPGPDGWFPEQRLTFQEALEGFTLGPAYAAGMEDRLGRLAPGYLADLVLLGEDPFVCDPSELRTMQPVATMIGGEWVWRS